MYITKICYMSCRLNSLIEKLDNLDDFDYSYRSIEGGDEVEIEADDRYLQHLLKLKFIKQEEYYELIEKDVDYIFFY